MRRTTSLPHTRIATLVDARGCCATIRITLRPAEASNESAPATAPAEPQGQADVGDRHREARNVTRDR